MPQEAIRRAIIVHQTPTLPAWAVSFLIANAIRYALMVMIFVVCDHIV
jgi:hypothetical protein